jgi:hypothetical protein
MDQSPSWEANSRSDSQEVSNFYGTRRFITVFTTARHRSLSWAKWTQFTTSHPTIIRSILILSFHLRKGFQGGLFPAGFPNKILYAFLMFLICATFSAHFTSPWFDHHNVIRWRVQTMKLPFTQFPPTSWHFIPLRPRYPSQRPVFEHNQTVFFPKF